MKKILFIVLIKVLTFSLNAQAEMPSVQVKKPAKLKYSLEFILEKVLNLKKQTLNLKIPAPKFYYESQTPLSQFQDAIEKQWGFRPDQFSNAYAVVNNEIYISDDAAYYKKTKHCMDDSVAHELTHFIQVKYQNWDLADESLEWDAVEIQTQFRDEFCILKRNVD